MRVLHILDHSLPIYDGYAFRSHNILLSQRAAGLEVSAITSPKHEEYAAVPPEPEEVVDGIEYTRTGAVNGTKVPFLRERSLMNAVAAKLEASVGRLKPDVLHAHSPILTAIPALKVGRARGIPVVYEIRSFWEDAAADQQGSYREGSLKYRLVRYLETRCCARADAVVPICEGLKADLVKRGLPAAKIQVVGNAIRPEQFQNPVPDEALRREWGLAGKTVIGFVGSFYHFEGLDHLVRAFAPVARDTPEARLLLVGGGEMADRLEVLAAELGIADRVVFPGRLPHERVPGAYALVDLLVYPRKPMRLTELVTPLKPLEAMAMGKALIASDVGGHRELVQDGETGVLYRAGSVDDLEAKLRLLLQDEDLRSRLGDQGQSWVRANRTWEKNAAAYKSLYEGLVASR